MPACRCRRSSPVVHGAGEVGLHLVVLPEDLGSLGADVDKGTAHTVVAGDEDEVLRHDGSGGIDPGLVLPGDLPQRVAPGLGVDAEQRGSGEDHVLLAPLQLSDHRGGVPGRPGGPPVKPSPGLIVQSGGTCAPAGNVSFSPSIFGTSVVPAGQLAMKSAGCRATTASARSVRQTVQQAHAAKGEDSRVVHHQGSYCVAVVLMPDRGTRTHTSLPVVMSMAHHVAVALRSMMNSAAATGALRSRRHSGVCARAPGRPGLPVLLIPVSGAIPLASGPGTAASRRRGSSPAEHKRDGGQRQSVHLSRSR